MNNIVELLEKNNIPYNPTMNRYGGTDIVCNYNLKSYIIRQEDSSLKLLEYSVANNKTKKNRYHLLDKFQLQDAKAIVEFIRTRKFYVLN